MRVGSIGCLESHESLLIDMVTFLIDEWHVDKLYPAVDGRLRRHAAQRYDGLNHDDSRSLVDLRFAEVAARHLAFPELSSAA